MCVCVCSITDRTFLKHITDLPRRAVYPTFYNLPSPRINTGRGVYWNDFVRPPICPSVLFSVRVCPDNISCTAQPCLTKLGTVVYYYKAERHAQDLTHYLQCQGHSESLGRQSMTISTISSKLLVHLQSNVV